MNGELAFVCIVTALVLFSGFYLFLLAWDFYE